MAYFLSNEPELEEGEFYEFWYDFISLEHDGNRRIGNDPAPPAGNTAPVLPSEET